MSWSGWVSRISSLLVSLMSLIRSAEFPVQVKSRLAQVLLVVKRCLMSTSLPSLPVCSSHFSLPPCQKRRRVLSLYIYYPLPHCKVTKQKKRKIYKGGIRRKTHMHTHTTTTSCHREARMMPSHRDKGLTAAFLGMFLASCIRTLMVSRGWQIRASMKPAVPPAIRLVRGDFFSLAAIVVYYLLVLLVAW